MPLGFVVVMRQKKLTNVVTGVSADGDMSNWPCSEFPHYLHYTGDEGPHGW